MNLWPSLTSGSLSQGCQCHLSAQCHWALQASENGQKLTSTACSCRALQASAFQIRNNSGPHISRTLWKQRQSCKWQLRSMRLRTTSCHAWQSIKRAVIHGMARRSMNAVSRIPSSKGHGFIISHESLEVSLPKNSLFDKLEMTLKSLPTIGKRSQIWTQLNVLCRLAGRWGLSESKNAGQVEQVCPFTSYLDFLAS